MEASGVCHTDLHAADGDWPVKPTPPFVPGHEGVGRVVALGPGVTRWRLASGSASPGWAARAASCEFCLSGWETLCERQQDSGYSINGSFEEYAVANAAYVARIPDGLDPAAAAPILCAGVTTYKALKVTDTQTRPVGRDLGRRRPRTHGRPVREGHGPPRGRGRHRR